VVDVSSGGLLGSVDGEVTGGYDENHLVVVSDRSARVLDCRSGKVARAAGPGRTGRLLTRVWLAPVRAAVPAGAIVLRVGPRVVA